jgi:branched-chain amino acid aminotransferase
MSGTPFCMLPVTSLNSIQIGDGKMGKITKLLLDTWGKNVGVDIIGQIKTWDRTRVFQPSDVPSPYAFKKKK